MTLVERDRLRRKPTAQVFKEIYENNKWSSDESVSGPGSSVDQTRVVREYVSHVLRKYEISSILDIPCGDFNWMSRVELGKIAYTGADIVPNIVELNIERYASGTVEFLLMDILNDQLRDVDLIICRDCLVHLSNKQINKSLRNICSTSSKYLLTTGFTDTLRNRDIAHGEWRPINLSVAPFGLPQPLEIVNEELTAYGGLHSDKSLMLWEIASIRNIVEQLP